MVDDTNLGCIDIIELMISLNSYGLRINDYDVASSLNFLLISFISTSKNFDLSVQSQRDQNQAIRYDAISRTLTAQIKKGSSYII